MTLFLIVKGLFLSSCRAIVAPIPDGGNNVDGNFELSDLLENEGMFEGDLQISLGLILSSYNHSDSERKNLIAKYHVDGGNKLERIRHEDAIDGTRFKLWPNGIIEYDFSSNFDRKRKEEVRRAMDHWEQRTCLRFIPRRRQDSNYIHFYTNYKQSGCFSTSIGFAGGKQSIHLLPRCRFGFAVHEIGHAIGFWHEQSRPDRDNYVTIHKQNVAYGNKNNNFLKRTIFQVDYQGSSYDYRSVMHYPVNWGSKKGCKGRACITLSVNNPEEYSRQGYPKLGDLNRGLSSEDIKQTNRLYKCPTDKPKGFLAVQIKRGFTIQDTDGIWNDPDPYVVLRAVDSKGNEHIQKTSYRLNTKNPVWNELILFGTNEWQFFRMTLWDDDIGADEVMSMSQTVPIEPGWHRNIKHCEYLNCSGYVTFDYNLDLRVIKLASLRIHVRLARNLSDSKVVKKKLDPYVRLEAVKSNGVKRFLTSRTVYDNSNPVWNEWIEFGCGKWNSLFIQIKDEDVGIDNKLSDKQWVFVVNGFHSNKVHKAYKTGYLLYEYSLILDVNNCKPNLCQHGANCTDGCGTYTCSCAKGYVGANCQHFAGSLKIKARFGRDLKGSNPYMEFTAIDVFGNPTIKSTNPVHGKSPIWDEDIVFIYQAWRQLKVQVYDRRTVTDRALSDQDTIALSRTGLKKEIRHKCKSGYAVFDYVYS